MVHCVPECDEQCRVLATAGHEHDDEQNDEKWNEVETSVVAFARGNCRFVNKVLVDTGARGVILCEIMRLTR